MTAGDGEPALSVVVTGAASGIGRSVASRLAVDGYVVVAVDRDREQLDEVVASVRQAGARAVAVGGDVADRDTHRRARDAAHDEGPLAAWIGCAGITRRHELTELTEREARDVVDANQFGLLWSAAEAVTEWTSSGVPGVFVAISSVHARHAAEQHTVYEMTKAAAEALVRSIAVTYGPIGVRAVAVAPGAIATPPLLASLRSADDPNAARAALQEHSPLERIGDPDEIASVVAFLISDQASYLSGASIPVDGGWSAVLSRSSKNPAARRST